MREIDPYPLNRYPLRLIVTSLVGGPFRSGFVQSLTDLVRFVVLGPVRDVLHGDFCHVNQLKSQR